MARWTFPTRFLNLHQQLLLVVPNPILWWYFLRSLVTYVNYMLSGNFVGYLCMHLHMNKNKRESLALGVFGIGTARDPGDKQAQE